MADTGHRLNEEELSFCWRSLAEQGQLSVSRLQTFFQLVAGERLSWMQAQDLLNYMDGNCDGRVGMDDFRSFMSTPFLADTDPGSFMWRPKAKHREERPPKVQEEEEPLLPRQFEALQADYSPPQALFPLRQNLAVDSLAETAVDEIHGRKVQRHRALSELMAELSEEPRQSGAPGPQHGKSRRSAQLQPVPPQEKPLRGRPRRAAVLQEEAPQPPQRSTPLQEEGEAPEVAAKSAADEERLKRIELALVKYEEVTWSSLRRQEAEAKKRVFRHFSQEEGEARELSPGEFHKMLSSWQGLAQWALPGEVEPGDSLAAMDYFVRRERHNKHCQLGVEGQMASSAAELKITYRLWLDILNGRHRPESRGP